jgi:hypothetical protein
VLNILVAKVKLNSSSVLASIRQIKAGRVPQHMRVNRELDTSRFTGARDDLINGYAVHWPTAFDHPINLIRRKMLTSPDITIFWSATTQL